MSRSGYSDDYDDDQWASIRWRGAVKSAIRGKRGQAFLRELLAALDAMPTKRLISDELRQPDGEVCALGSIGVARGIELESLDPHDYDKLAETFGISSRLVQEIEWENDDAWGSRQTPEQRFQHVREWVVEQIKV